MSDEQKTSYDPTNDLEKWLQDQENRSMQFLGFTEEQTARMNAPQIVDFSGDVYVRPCNRGINLYKPDGNSFSLDDAILDGIRQHLPNFSDGDIRLAIDIRLLPAKPEEAAE